MSGVLVGRPVILVAIVIGALGGAPAWASRDSHAGSAPPTPLRLAASAANVRFIPLDGTAARALTRVAQSCITVSDAATEGDEEAKEILLGTETQNTASIKADLDKKIVLETVFPDVIEIIA